MPLTRALWLAAALVLASGAAAAAPLERVTRRGPVEVSVRLEPAEPVIGDALHLEIEALAPEGVELLMPEFGEALDRFAVVDFAPSEGLADDGRTRALQRYTLQPAMSGPQSVPPLLVEFVDRRPGQRASPEDADAYEVLTERIDFQVASVLPSGAVPDLRPPPGELAPLGRGAAARAGWWLAAALVVLASIALVLRRFLAARVERRSAWEIAHAELDALLARARPGPDETDAFYVELSGLIRRYLERRFELRSPELTTEEFFEVAGRSSELVRAQRERLRDFLRGADLVKFAAHQPSADEVSAALDAAGGFLDETRTAAPDPEPQRAAEPLRA